jgi:hypothetical protein
MKKLVQTLVSTALVTWATSTFAAPPRFLLTNNMTDYTAGAYVNGTVPPQHPTLPNSKGKVYWGLISIACHSFIVDGKCPALVKLGQNNQYPIEIGYVYLDMNTGEITPKVINNNGFTLTVNGPGETTITQD